MIYNQMVTWTAFAILAMFYLLPDGGGWARHNQSTVAEPLERAVPMIMRKFKVIYGINVAADVYRM